MSQESLDSKRLVKALFKRRDLPSIPFIPFASSCAAKLAQIPLRAMLTDPTPLVNHLQDCYKLLGYDGVSLAIDSGLEAEACGCEVEWEAVEKGPRVNSHPLEGKDVEQIRQFDVSDFERKGRIPIVLEGIKRLDIMLGKQAALVGTVTGPLTLAAHLGGDSVIERLPEDSEQSKELIKLAASVSLKLSRLYCDLKVDVIVIAEELLSRLDPTQIAWMLSTYRTMWNVIRFYRVNPVLLVKDCKPSQVEAVFKLEADGFIIDGNIPVEELSEFASRYGCCFSRGIAQAVLLGTPSDASKEVESMIQAGASKKGFFLSTGWEVPYDTSVENLHEIMRVIRAHSSSPEEG